MSIFSGPHHLENILRLVRFHSVKNICINYRFPANSFFGLSGSKEFSVATP